MSGCFHAARDPSPASCNHLAIRLSRHTLCLARFGTNELRRVAQGGESLRPLFACADLLPARNVESLLKYNYARHGGASHTISLPNA